MHSRAIGNLAERFYIFLSYKGEDLFEIVLEDGGKITPRSYHLVREVFLQGSILESFIPVFAKFIDLFWRTGSLSQEKINWIKFFSNDQITFSAILGAIEKILELTAQYRHGLLDHISFP